MEEFTVLSSLEEVKPRLWQHPGSPQTPGEQREPTRRQGCREKLEPQLLFSACPMKNSDFSCYSAALKPFTSDGSKLDRFTRSWEHRFLSLI